MSWIVTCPQCGCKGDARAVFGLSLADECFCPACGMNFEMQYPDDDEEEE